MVALAALMQTAMAEDGPPEPTAPLSAASGPVECEDSPPGLWERSTLLGSFDGKRTELCRTGIQFGATHQSEFLGNAVGGQRTGGKYQGRTEFDLELDFDKLAEISGLTAHASAYWINGGRLSKNVGSIMPTSNIEAVPGLRLNTLWVQQSLWGDLVNLRLGQLAADDEFLTSKVSSTFINGTFGWAAMVAADLPSGGPGFPLPTPGARLKINFNDQISWMAGVFDADPGGKPPATDAAYNPQWRNHSGTTFSLDEGTFTISEAAYAVNQGKSDPGLAATYKLGGWYNSESFFDQRWDQNHVSLAAPNALSTGNRLRGNWGVYGVVDQMLLREEVGSDQGLSAFMRLGGSPSDRNQVAYYLDAGLAYKGPFQRPDDTVGVAFAYASLSDSLAALDRDNNNFNATPTRPIRDFESVIELTYQAQITPWWTVQPDVQYIIHPGGNIPNPGSIAGLRPVGDAAVFGARTALKF